MDLERLTAAQAEIGHYPYALAGYLLWVADQWEHLAEALPQARLEQRTRLLTEMSGSHLRIPDVLATLYLGLDLGLAYAVEVGALTEVGAQTWRERGWEALKAGAEAQARRVERERPTVRFLEVLGNLLAQGRAVLEARDGEGKIVGVALRVGISVVVGSLVWEGANVTLVVVISLPQLAARIAMIEIAIITLNAVSD